MAEFHPIAWAEEHPYMTGGIVFGGGLLLLWMLGYIGGSKTASDGGTANLAAAYYAAEAQQAVAGTQLNIAEDQANAAVKVQQIQGDSAVAINASNNTAAVAMASNMYAADVTKASYAADVAKVQSNDAVAASVAANNYAYLTATAGYQAGEYNNFVSTIIPQEIDLAKAYGVGGMDTSAPGIGGFHLGVGDATPAAALAAGYTPKQVQQMYGPQPFPG